MRYIASAYAIDTRPERPAKDKDAETPEGGWRTKSGVRKLGNRATIDADSFGDAVSKTAELIGALPKATQEQVVRVKVEVDDSDPEQAGNPFDG